MPSGATVQDTVTVSPNPSGPTPTGNVTFTLFKSATCDPGAGTISTETKALDASGTATSSIASGLADGNYGYQATYAGDPNYPAATGACEPFTVGPTTTPCPGGKFTIVVDPTTGDANIVYDQFPAPNDNSYGVNAVGWGSQGHKFNDLVGSDHAGFEVDNASGTAVLDFNIDYLTAKTGTPSGYASLGPFGGDGKVNVGSLTSSDVTWDTSLARDLNNLGYFSGGTQTVGTGVANLLVNSPPTLDTVSNYTLTSAAAAAFTGTETNPDGTTTTGWNFHDTVLRDDQVLEAAGDRRDQAGERQVAAEQRLGDPAERGRAAQLACQAVPVHDRLDHADDDDDQDDDQRPVRLGTDLQPAAVGERQQLQHREADAVLGHEPAPVQRPDRERRGGVPGQERLVDAVRLQGRLPEREVRNTLGVRVARAVRRRRELHDR